MQLPSDKDRSGRDLGEQELAYLTEVIRSGTLNSTRGTFVPRLEREFAKTFARKHAVACASGSAAIHAALAALRCASGDEIVTTAITDMGAIMPILYEGLVPAFCDVDPRTCNVTAETIAARLTPRTRAVIVTHLFGNPCDMEPIRALARDAKVAIIEDCAQAFLAEDRIGRAGTLSELACFSFQQGKHMTTGEGGIVITDDPALADRVTRFVNKGWGYGDTHPDHDRPGLNYRLTELQGAVGVAQLEKLAGCVARRQHAAKELDALLADEPGLATPLVRSGTRHAYWRYALTVDPSVIGGGAQALGAALREAGVACVPRYIEKPAFECAVFTRERERYPVMQGARAVDTAAFPGTYRALERVLVLPWNEAYTSEHVRFVAEKVQGAARALRHG